MSHPLSGHCVRSTPNGYYVIPPREMRDQSYGWNVVDLEAGRMAGSKRVLELFVARSGTEITKTGGKTPFEIMYGSGSLYGANKMQQSNWHAWAQAHQTLYRQQGSQRLDCYERYRNNAYMSKNGFSSC